MKVEAMLSDARYIKAASRAADFSLYDPIPIFRKEITLTESPRSCELLIQSPGFASCYINGTPVTEDLFISPISDYKKILWYNVYDVSSLLRVGGNTVAVIASNGFLNESFGTAWDYDKASWRDAPQFLLALSVNGEPTLVSDSSWRVSTEDSHVVFSHLRSGEYVDMRKNDPSRLLCGYDDSHWKQAIECPKGADARFIRCLCPPVREVESLAPVSIRAVPRGFLVDFGLNVSGYISLTLCEERGREIGLYHAEEVLEDGSPKHNNMDDKYFFYESPFQKDMIIASGGTDLFKPLFTYHGFRYVLIEGMNAPPSSDCIRAHFIHNDVKRTSDFSCGDDLLNYVYTAGIRSTYSNMFWCLTDCPTREKLGWLNDAQATAEQTLINFDVLPLYEKWYEDIKADMCEDGSLHGTVPTHGWGLEWGPVCDCYLFELPYRIYLYTGRSDMTVGALPYFERYIAYLEKRVAEDHEFILGDWLGHGSSPLTPKEFVRDFYLIKAYTVTELAYRLAGATRDGLSDRLSELRDAFIARYVDASGRCTVAEQCPISMLLAGGLYRDREALCEQLVSVVLRDRLQLTCGMVGVQYLYDALAMCGRSDLVCRMISESEPGYRSWYEQGATTLWECWNGIDNGSHNHHMFSNVLAWLFKGLLGIAPDPDAPAFKRITLRPSFVRELGHAEGRMTLPQGEIALSWRYEDGGFIYRVCLPEGVEAYFDSKPLTVGENIFFVKEQ